MKKYKIAMIGHGGFGKFLVENYQEMEEIEIAAVVGANEKEVEAFAREYKIPFWTTDYKDVLKKPEIDVVAIVTPPHLHCEMTVEAARAGKAILVEKPFAMSLDEADKMISEIEENKVPSTIGYVMRYSSIYDKVRELTRSKSLGKLKRMIFENYASGHLPDSHWLFDQSKSGGLLVEHGVHFFDIFDSIVGLPYDRAKSWTPSPRETLAVVEYPGEVIATFYHAFDKPGNMEKNGAKFIYEKGYVEVDGWIPMSVKVEFENDKGRIITAEEKVPHSKDAEYRILVKEVLRDLVLQINDPDYRAKVGVKEARDSLALALEARENKIFGSEKE